MKSIGSLVKFLKKKALCDKDNHDWEYYTRGNAVVDNLDDTFSMWEIGTRSCSNCKKHQVNLKSGWQEDKELVITDLI